MEGEDTVSIYLSHLTALRYWRSVGHPRVLGAGPTCLIAHELGRPQGTARVRRIPEGEPDVALAHEVVSRAFAGIDAPLDLLVARAEDRRPSYGVACHVIGDELPVGSFVKVREGVYVSSPALCLVQLADLCSEYELALLAYEFCGIAGPSHAVRYGLFERRPLASAAALRDYMARGSRLQGSRKASRFLRYVLNRAASPMEGVLVLKLHLPGRYGGYGHGAPLLNHRVELPPEARMHTGKKYFVYDLHWPLLRIAVEYDSDAAHGLDSLRNNDSVRRATIQSMGESVVTVRTNQLFDTQLMDDVSAAIARGAGIRRQDRAANVGVKRETLHRGLLGPWLNKGSSLLFGRNAEVCPQPIGWRSRIEQNDRSEPRDSARGTHTPNDQLDETDDPWPPESSADEW